MARTKAADLPQTPELVGANVVAVAETLALLDADSASAPALRALALTLAAQLDAGAGMATAAVSKELRAVIESLTPEDRSADDAFSQFTRQLSAEVSHPATS